MLINTRILVCYTRKAERGAVKQVQRVRGIKIGSPLETTDARLLYFRAQCGREKPISYKYEQKMSSRSVERVT